MKVVASINRTEGQAHGVRLELFKWKRNVTPQIGPKPQQVVALRRRPTIFFLGIMSAQFRCGGTEQEFRAALAKGETAGTPWITFYFDDDPKVSRKR